MSHRLTYCVLFTIATDKMTSASNTHKKSPKDHSKSQSRMRFWVHRTTKRVTIHYGGRVIARTTRDITTIHSGVVPDGVLLRAFKSNEMVHIRQIVRENKW